MAFASAPVRFAWQARYLLSSRGRMYALGSLGRRTCAGVICVAGARCSPNGRVYALGSLGRRSCAGTCYTHALGPLGRRACAGVICVAGAVLAALYQMYALGSLGRRSCAGVICVAGAVLAALQGVRCILGHRTCAGVICGGTCCSPRGRMYVLGSLGRSKLAWYLLLLKGSDVRPGAYP